MLRRIHGADRAQRTRVDLDATFIWSQLHGLASIAQARVMEHPGLAPQASRQMVAHAMHMMGLSLDAAHPDPSSTAAVPATGRP